MSSGVALNVPLHEHEKARIFFNSITVCKIPLLQPSTRTKPATASQKVLNSLLEKRRSLYQARQRTLQQCRVNYNNASSNPSVNTSADFALSLSIFPLVPRMSPAKAFQERKSIRFVIEAPKGKQSHNQFTSASCHHLQPKSQSSDFIDINSKELAERVVKEAKLRLKRGNERKENLITNRETFRTSTPILAGQKIQQSKITQSKITKFAPSKERLDRKYSQPSINAEDCLTKSKRPYDPGTPSATNFLKMTLKLKEAEIEAKMLKEAGEKRRKLKIEEEKKIRSDDIAKLKAQQRAEIYQLNKVMAEYEKEQFEAGKV